MLEDLSFVAMGLARFCGRWWWWWVLIVVMGSNVVVVAIYFLEFSDFSFVVVCVLVW